ncbi:MAG: hypothetical protein EOO40_01510 [Deltaproteobacteria bacterium]|nr:MAG: hypothetical protein EOO40_01510 [Deltaproteobacteria bacterium]
MSPYAMDTVTGKHNHVNQKVRSGTVGYLPDGTPTSWTERNNRTLQAVLPHLRKCAEAYRHTLPSAYRCQTSATATRRIGDTPFRILFVNRNFRTALHRDNNVCASAMGVMIVVGAAVRGCRIQFPEISAEVDVQPGDVLMFHPHLWHCNTPLEKPADRMSIICHG